MTDPVLAEEEPKQKLAGAPATDHPIEGLKSSERLSSRSLTSDRVEHEANGETVDLEKMQSEPTPEAVKVPRAQRRGLFGRFTIVAEVTEPKNYPRSTKWFITFVVASAAVAAPLGSAILFRKIFS